MTQPLDFSDNPWLINFNLKMHNKKRLFTFSYSGAGAGIYHSWAKKFHEAGIDLIAVQLPGREQRISEKKITSLPDLTGQLLDVINPLTDMPFAFFGHSLGGLIAFELSRQLSREKCIVPQHLFISGFRSPEMPNPNQELHQLNDTKLLEKITEYGGTPDIILQNRELMTLLLPIVRADFKLFETYQYKSDRPIDCPLTIFSGSQDNIVKPSYMHNWKFHTSKELKKIVYQGNHFFINQHKEDLIKEIINQLN